MSDAQGETFKHDTNNFIIQQKTIVKKLSRNALNVIRCSIQRLSSKIEKNENNSKKLQSKVDSLKAEIPIIKGFNICEVLKFAIINERTYKEVIADPKCTTEQKALYRLIDNPSVSKSISDFLDSHPEMKDRLYAASIIYGLGAKRKKNKRSDMERQELRGKEEKLQMWLDSYAKLPRTAAFSHFMDMKDKTHKNIKSDKQNDKTHKNIKSEKQNDKTHKIIKSEKKNDKSTSDNANNEDKIKSNKKPTKRKAGVICHNTDSADGVNNSAIPPKRMKESKMKPTKYNTEDSTSHSDNKPLISANRKYKLKGDIGGNIVVTKKLGEGFQSFKRVMQKRKEILPDDESSDEEEFTDRKIDKSFLSRTVVKKKESDDGGDIFSSGKYFKDNVFRSKEGNRSSFF